MKKIKLLISGIGGSLFPYLIEKLNVKYDLYFVDNNQLVKKIYTKEKVFIVSSVNTPSYEEEILNIINKYKINFYIPLIDEEILKAINISKTNSIKVLSPKEDFVNLTLNKYELMKKLQELNISTLDTQMASENYSRLNFPLFLKPNTGRGSRGIRKVDTIEEFEAYFILEKYKKEDILIQRYVAGEEYTVSVTVNNLNNVISIVPKIVYIKEGITKYAKSIKHKKIEELCLKIVTHLKPYGSFNVQLKIENDNIYVFEINPRFSTTLVLSVESGINEIDLCIENYNKNNVEYISHFEETILIRRWENLFLKGSV